MTEGLRDEGMIMECGVDSIIWIILIFPSVLAVIFQVKSVHGE